MPKHIPTKVKAARRARRSERNLTPKGLNPLGDRPRKGSSHPLRGPKQDGTPALPCPPATTAVIF